jgi:hypothetical protein
MGLIGCYPNPEIQGRLRQLSEKLERLAASNAAPRPSYRQDQRLRSGLIPKAIERVLRDALGPMRARDIHVGVEEVLGRSAPTSSVKNWLAKQARWSNRAVKQHFRTSVPRSDSFGQVRSRDHARAWGALGPGSRVASSAYACAVAAAEAQSATGGPRSELGGRSPLPAELREIARRRQRKPPRPDV